MLSVIIITKNEIDNIADCLDSVAWADEIIVVDSGSSDGTKAVCLEKKCHFFEHDWPGFGEQKNRALSYAQHEWVLSIDADERVSTALKEQILAVVATTDQSCDGYYLPRQSSYCGRFIKHSGWSPDFVLRLFKRDKAQFSNNKVHEKVLLEGVLKRLSKPLIHFSVDSLEQVLSKVDSYSTLAAEQLYAEGKRASLLKAVFRGFWSFFRTYFLRLGFLDGAEGFMLSVSNAEGTYYKYAKLALLTKSS